MSERLKETAGRLSPEDFPRAHVTRTVPSTAGVDGNTDDELLHEDMVGKIVGNFRIVSILGSGGMGVVYEAEDLVMQRTVALKMIHSTMIDPQTRKRLQQESRAVSKLSHENIVKVYSFELTEDGSPYLVMEYVDGKLLSDPDLKSQLTNDQCLEIFISLADALSHAHNMGVIHRDLKPNNVVVCDWQLGIRGEKIKILDFGIAKLLPECGKETFDLTSTGQPIGSPSYMSPEQCQAQELDARSDIYSLGCVMYYLLAGRPPFLGESVFAVWAKHLGERPEPFSSACPQRRVSASLEEIVLKALSKKPAGRYQTMAELKVELEKLRNQIALASFAAGTRRALRSNTVRVALGLGVAVATLPLFMGLAGSVREAANQIASRFQRPCLQSQWAIQDKQVDEESAHKNFELAQKRALVELEYANQLGNLDPAVYTTCKKLSLLSLSQGKTSEAESFAAKAKEVSWLNYSADLGNSSTNSALIAKCAKMIASGATLSKEQREDFVDALNKEATCSLQSRQTDRSAAQCQQAFAQEQMLDAGGSASPQDERLSAITNMIAGNLHLQKGEFAEAEQVLTRSDRLFQKVFDEKLSNRVSSLIELADLKRQTNEYDQAQLFLNKAKGILTAQDIPESIFAISSLECEASLREGQGDYAEALKMYQRARDLQRSRTGEESLTFIDEAIKRVNATKALHGNHP